MWPVARLHQRSQKKTWLAIVRFSPTLATWNDSSSTSVAPATWQCGLDRGPLWSTGDRDSQIDSSNGKTLSNGTSV